MIDYAAIGPGPVMGIRGERYVDLNNPRPEDFQPEDTAWALARVNRYSGNFGAYSVAQHAVLVARVVQVGGGFPPQILAGVHHDDSESITGDLPRPTKDYLRQHTNAWDILEESLNAAIEARYQVDLDDHVVRWADKVVFYWEVQRLVPVKQRSLFEPECSQIKLEGIQLPYHWFAPWSLDEAAARYLDTHTNAAAFIEGHDPGEEFTSNAS